MNEYYQIEFGVFERTEEFDAALKSYWEGNDPHGLGLNKIRRPFIPVFEQVLPKDEMIKKLKVFVNGWREEMFDKWLHKPDRPTTFIIGGKETGYGYRVTELKMFSDKSNGKQFVPEIK